VEATQGGSAEVNIATEIVEGFMGTEIPVTKLDDGNVKFWIPWHEWKNVHAALEAAMLDYPEHMEKL
jgi:hypothetical protein